MKEFLFTVLAAIFAVLTLISTCISLAYITNTIFTFFYQTAMSVSVGKITAATSIGMDLAMNLMGCAVVCLLTVALFFITDKLSDKSRTDRTDKKEEECLKHSE